MYRDYPLKRYGRWAGNPAGYAMNPEEFLVDCGDKHPELCVPCVTKAMRAFAAQECAAQVEKIMEDERRIQAALINERDTLQQRVEVVERAVKWLDEFVVEPEWFPNEGDRQFWQEKRAALRGSGDSR